MIRFDRKFLFWRYTVSHQQILLRSVKPEHGGTRIDILFKAVKHICIPTTIENIVIEELELSSVSRSHPSWPIPDIPHVHMFKVSDNHGEGYIVAGAIAYFEDEGEYNSPGKFDDTMMILADE